MLPDAQHLHMQSIAILAVLVPLLNLLPLLRWIPFPSVFGAQDERILAIGKICMVDLSNNFFRNRGKQGTNKSLPGTRKERRNFGPRPRQLFPSGFFFLGFFFLGIGPCRLVPPPALECNSILPLVNAVLITPKGAEPPGSRRIGVISALVFILPSETV